MRNNLMQSEFLPERANLLFLYNLSYPVIQQSFINYNNESSRLKSKSFSLIDISPWFLTYPR